jgi:hypothetical protein
VLDNFPELPVSAGLPDETGPKGAAGPASGRTEMSAHDKIDGHLR